MISIAFFTHPCTSKYCELGQIIFRYYLNLMEMQKETHSKIISFFLHFHLYFRRHLNLLNFKKILSSIQSPKDLEKQHMNILKLIRADGNGMLLRELEPLQIMVNKALFLLTSPFYLDIMQVRLLFFSPVHTESVTCDLAHVYFKQWYQNRDHQCHPLPYLIFP